MGFARDALRISDCGLRITDYGLRITDWSWLRQTTPQATAPDVEMLMGSQETQVLQYKGYKLAPMACGLGGWLCFGTWGLTFVCYLMFGIC